MTRFHPPPDAWFWLGAFAVGTLVEVFAVRRHRPTLTLSHFTRWVFRTDTLVGRLVFIVGWRMLTDWFPEHILKQK